MLSLVTGTSLEPISPPLTLQVSACSTSRIMCDATSIAVSRRGFYLLTYSMVQSPSWEANWFAASQEIPRISRNPKDSQASTTCRYPGPA